MFECLVGYPPFCSENAHDTYRKIIDWQHRLSPRLVSDPTDNSLTRY